MRHATAAAVMSAGQERTENRADYAPTVRITLIPVMENQVLSAVKTDITETTKHAFNARHSALPVPTLYLVRHARRDIIKAALIV